MPTPGIGIVAASEAVATRLGIEGVIVVRATLRVQRHAQAFAASTWRATQLAT